MKLTPESVFHEDTPVTPKKEKRPKKERKFGRKRNDVLANEDVSEEMAEQEDAPPITDDPELVDEADMTQEIVPAKKPMKKGMIVGIVIAAVFGVGLCAIGVRGLLSVKSMNGSEQKPAKTVSEEYQTVLDAKEEGFEDANQKRLDEKAQKEDETKIEETTGLETEPVKEEDITVDAGAAERSKEEQIATLQSEIDSLKQQVTDAQNQATAMEQELNNTKALLSASESREAQLQSQLDMATSSSVK